MTPADATPNQEECAADLIALMKLGESVDLYMVDEKLAFSACQLGQRMAASVFAKWLKGRELVDGDVGFWKEFLVNAVGTVPAINTTSRAVLVLNLALANYRANFARLIAETATGGRL